MDKNLIEDACSENLQHGKHAGANDKSKNLAQNKADSMVPLINDKTKPIQPQKNISEFLKADNEPQASTSSSQGSKSGMAAVGRSLTVCDGRPSYESLKKQRKSLPLIPRISQYEKNPLLQTKTSGGLSEFEMFLLYKEEGMLRRSSAVEEKTCDTDEELEETTVSNTLANRRLQPRSAHAETHPLLKKSESGLYEIEEFLLEKEQERSEGAGKSRAGRSLERAATVGKLEPRTSQWERNPLLEFKDEFGLTEMERMLEERHRELSERGKCCADSTCKSSNCKNCKGRRSKTSTTGESMSSSSCPQVSPDPSSASDPRRKVRFDKEEEETGSTSVAHSAVDTQHIGLEPDTSKLDLSGSEGRKNSKETRVDRSTNSDTANLSSNAGGISVATHNSAIDKSAPKKNCCIS